MKKLHWFKKLKVVYILGWLSFFVIFAFLVSKCDLPKTPEEANFRSVMYSLPVGAELVEIIASYENSNITYYIYEFRGQCFFKSSEYRRGATNINCPEDMDIKKKQWRSKRFG